jgi:predicted anti-sigma-YlaC factor YlaD
MKCKKIRSLIYDYEDKAEDKVLHSVIESHLAGCAACRLHYETQRRLHQRIAESAVSELAGFHFKSASIKAEPAGERTPVLKAWPLRMALAASCMFVLCTATWVLWKPVRKPADDIAPSAYAEAYRYIDMGRTDKPGASSFATPLAVIIQPGIPARIIELDGETNVSDALR